jgi:superfamily I DNA/RNA helicase
MKKKIKLYQLKNIKDCKFKAYISQFSDFKILNNKASMISQIYKTIIKDYDFIKLTNEKLKDIISTLMEDKYFLTNQEKEVESNIILHHLSRYITYEKLQNRKILSKDTYGNIELNGEEIEVKADIIFENANSIEIVKIKTSATELSYKARTDKNLPENDIELYLLKVLGEQLYSKSDKPIIASFYHLKGKKDKETIYTQFLSDEKELLKSLNNLKLTSYSDKKMQKEVDKQIKEISDILYFNNSEGNNIISFDYSKSLDDKIIELLNSELSFNSDKCKSNDCDFCNYSTLCNYENTDNKKNLEIVKSIKKSNSKIELTDAQKQVVDVEDGNYRINAVAGSGKSSSVVTRTVELFDKGFSIEDILLITFTNKGTSELKDKIKKLKNIDNDKLHIFTFNSFGDSIVSKEWETLGFTQKPQLASIIDINDIIKEMLQMTEYGSIEWLNYKNPLLNYPHAKGAFKQLIIYFNIIKSYSYDVNTFNEKVLAKEKVHFDNKANLIYEMYAKFNKMLKAKNLLQYQDQILYLIELFEKNPNLINIYGYKHVIVDEYQDTDFTQVKLLHLLEKYKDFKSLMIVGDDVQAIYGFRNTTPENILNFDKEFADVNDIFLLDNFRSTPEICHIANELSKLNTQRIDKDITSRKEHGKEPSLIQYDSLEDEYTGITNCIKEHIDNDIPKHDICVIARTKKELLEIQSYLNKENIPSNIEASELFIDNINVQCIVNIGNFFKNTEHDYYLMEYLYLTKNDFIGATNEDIISYTNDFKTKLLELFNTLESEEEKIDFFYTLIYPLVEKDDIAKSFVENLQGKTFYSFSQFLEYLYKVILYHDDTSIDKDENKYDAVTLTTAHSSKGKEWGIVITTINSFHYEDIQDDLTLLEEERRLLFVDITRAKNELYITYNTNQNKTRNKGKYCLFADELNTIIEKK